MSERLALDGGTPVRTAGYPAWPEWNQEEERALLETLHSGDWWASEGVQVRAFESEFAAYHQARFGIACTSGSAALEVALRAAGVDWGDEVITSPYTFIATAAAILMVGAVPRFADIRPESWNMDAAKVEALITPRTKAILPVHIGGEPADMDSLRAVAAKHRLPLIEDAAQAHGAIWNGHKIGALGDMGTFSFQASKNVASGEGGIVLTNDQELAYRCGALVNVGRAPAGAVFQPVNLAGNHRMAEWMGAVLRVQLGRLDEQANRRSANAAYLAEALSEVPGITPVPGDPRVARNALHLFKLAYDPQAFGGKTRGELLRAMEAEGIPLRAGYQEPLARHKGVTQRSAYIRERLGMASQDPDACPVCEDVCQRGMWFYQAVLLAERGDLDDIVTALAKVQRAWGA